MTLPAIRSEPGFDRVAFARRVLEAEAASLLLVASRLDDSFEWVVERLGRCTGRIAVTGIGKSADVGEKLAAALGMRLLYLPSDSPNLNRIERLWGFTKRRSVSGKYHANVASFRAAIETTLQGVPTHHADELTSLMTLKFQTLNDVSLLAA